MERQTNAVQCLPFCGFRSLCSQTFESTRWAKDLIIARPLPTQKNAQWHSNPWSQCSSGRRHYKPQTAWQRKIWLTMKNITAKADEWFEVLTAVVMNISIFWDTTPCSPLKACGLLCAGFLPGLLFSPDDGGDMFLRNVSWDLTQ
jgi:hypothetical protein